MNFLKEIVLLFGFYRETMQETSKPAPPARPVPPNVRPPRPRLPFEKGPTDLGSWAYEHRVGLCCMIIAYLAFGIVFVSVKIAMNQERVEGAMYIDLTDMQQALEALQQQVPEQQDEGDDFSNVKTGSPMRTAVRSRSAVRRRRLRAGALPRRNRSPILWRGSTKRLRP